MEKTRPHEPVLADDGSALWFHLTGPAQGMSTSGPAVRRNVYICRHCRSIYDADDDGNHGVCPVRIQEHQKTEADVAQPWGIPRGRKR